MKTRLLDAALRYFRKRRMREFARTFGITPETRVLDVGGTPFNWSLLSVRPRLTILNLPRTKEEMEPGVNWVGGDGCLLPFRDRSFDVVFSNSVIEHVGELETQRVFAREIARVGVGYYVQTPNRWFPIEPHLLTPFHFLPKKWQRRLVNRFTIWAMLVRPTPDRRDFYLQHYLNDIRLLDCGEMEVLFPEAEIRKERLFGLTKACVAVRTAHYAARAG